MAESKKADLRRIGLEGIIDNAIKSVDDAQKNMVHWDDPMIEVQKLSRWIWVIHLTKFPSGEFGSLYVFLFWFLSRLSKISPSFVAL